MARCSCAGCNLHRDGWQCDCNGCGAENCGCFDRLGHRRLEKCDTIKGKGHSWSAIGMQLCTPCFKWRAEGNESPAKGGACKGYNSTGHPGGGYGHESPAKGGASKGYNLKGHLGGGYEKGKGATKGDKGKPGAHAKGKGKGKGEKGNGETSDHFEVIDDNDGASIAAQLEELSLKVDQVGDSLLKLRRVESKLDEMRVELGDLRSANWASTAQLVAATSDLAQVKAMVKGYLQPDEIVVVENQPECSLMEAAGESSAVDSSRNGEGGADGESARTQPENEWLMENQPDAAAQGADSSRNGEV